MKELKPQVIEPVWRKKEGYKVVSVDRLGIKSSACVNDNFSELLRVKYFKDEVSFPMVEGSRLFFFDDINDARKFLEGFYTCFDISHELWKCKVDRSVSRVRPASVFSVNEILYKWKWSKLCIMEPSNYYTKKYPTTRALMLTEFVESNRRGDGQQFSSI